MIPAGIRDILKAADRYPRVNELFAFCNEVVPFMVFGHRDGTSSELLYSIQGDVRLALQDTSIGIICLLYLANYDCLEFTTGIFQIQICLVRISHSCETR